MRLFPRLRELRRADLLEPGAAVGHRVAHDGVGQGQPLAVHHVGGGVDVVEAALGLGELAGHVAHVHHRVGVELGPVVLEHEDVGARAGLDRGGDARLQVVRVDGLEGDLGPEGLGGLRHLALQLDVGLGDEVHPAHPVELRALRERGRAARGQDALDAGHRHRGGSSGLDERTAVEMGERGVVGVGLAHERLVLLDRVNRGTAGVVPQAPRARVPPPTGYEPRPRGCDLGNGVNGVRVECWDTS